LETEIERCQAELENVNSFVTEWSKLQLAIFRSAVIIQRVQLYLFSGMILPLEPGLNVAGINNKANSLLGTAKSISLLDYHIKRLEILETLFANSH
jgi:hypothetical protein